LDVKGKAEIRRIVYMNSENNTSPQPLEAGSVLPPKGVIEATVTREIEEPQQIGDAFYLPYGETLWVEAGTAYLIKGEDKWYLAQFFEEGRMHGPVVYSKTVIEKPLKAYKASDHFLAPMSALMGAVLLCVIGIILAIQHYSAPDAAPLRLIPETKADVFALTCTAAITFFYTWMFVDYVRPHLEGERKLIRRLKATREQKVLVKSPNPFA
jgi:hypothetical protein